MKRFWIIFSILVLFAVSVAVIFGQSKQQAKKSISKMEERYSFVLTVHIPDKGTAQEKAFLSLAKKYNVIPVIEKKKTTKLIFNVLEKNIEESMEIQNAFTELAKKYKLGVGMRGLE